MVITGGEPTPAEAEQFIDEWPVRLEARLGWFVCRAGTDLTLDRSAASLDPAATWVLERLGVDDPVEER